MAKIFQLTEELGLSIEEVDKLTGDAIGSRTQPVDET
jgi:3-hydroxyacyl-CoA dehydrogenase